MPDFETNLIPANPTQPTCWELFTHEHTQAIIKTITLYTLGIFGSFALYIMNPAISLSCFFIGIALSKKVLDLAAAIVNVWRRLSFVMGLSTVIILKYTPPTHLFLIGSIFAFHVLGAHASQLAERLKSETSSQGNTPFSSTPTAPPPTVMTLQSNTNTPSGSPTCIAPPMTTNHHISNLIKESGSGK